jgi:hypothetical protein
MSRPYGYDEGYQDGYEAAETNKDAEIAEQIDEMAFQDTARQKLLELTSSQAAEIKRLREDAQALLDALTDRWAVKWDHHCFAANALVEATHDALAKALEVDR